MFNKENMTGYQAGRREFIVTLGAGLALARGTQAAGLNRSGGHRELVLNPYAGVDWSGQHKGNCHTHTTISDGKLQPHEAVDAYRKLGYSILAITDHDAVTYPWTDFKNAEPTWANYKGEFHDAENRDPKALGMVAVEGNEISSRVHHHLSLFSNFNRDSECRKDFPGVLADIRAHSDRAVTVIAHPAMHWPRKYSGGLSVTMSKPLRNLTSGDFTLETWFRTKDAGRAVLIGNYASGSVSALNLELHTDNRIRLYVMPAQSRPTIDLTVSMSEFDINTRDGNWHHLAGVRQDGKIQLYLDGRLVGERADASGMYTLGGNLIYLGRDARGSIALKKGGLADVRLWTRGLRGSEISGIFSGEAPDEKGLLARYDFGTGSEALVADTANHPDGPFQAKATAKGLVSFSSSVPKPLQCGIRVARSIQFGEFPLAVPAAAVAEYLDLYQQFDTEFLVGIEVLNGTRPFREYGLDRELWDRLLHELMPHRPVWGFANDDMHSTKHLGLNWLTFPVSSPDVDKVRKAIISGAFYFSSILPAGDAGAVDGTPRIEEIRHDPDAGTLAVYATNGGKPVDEKSVQWIADGKTVFVGTELDYRHTPGIFNYVRAEVIGSGGMAYTNPFGF